METNPRRDSGGSYQMELKWPSGYVLCAVTDDENAIEDAKTYCKNNNYTPEQVEIIRTNGVVIVRVK